MTPRKRKAPDRKKKQVKGPGLPARFTTAAARAVARRPRQAFGISSFVVVFSFVAANALWYQPGGHPAPFLATRDLKDPSAIAGYRPARRPPPEDVTTFRIAREGEVPPAEAVPSAQPPAAQSPAGQPSTDQPSAARPPDELRPLVAEVQRQLARRGLYDGVADGVVGPQTTAAIRTFQQGAGLPPTGEVGAALVAALKAEPEPQAQLASLQAEPPVDAVAVPVARPREDVSAAAEDPVAAAIREAEQRASSSPAVTPVAARPGDTGGGLAPSPELVIQIQRGLSNIAYSDVAVDGVAGSQTRAAIRRFEKHYRLPETGEPNEMVLKKLKSIGAL